MKRWLSIVLVFTFLFSMVAIAGCTKTVTNYVCVNGSVLPAAGLCGTNKLAAVKKVDAETYAKNFVNAFFTPYGGKSQLVSSYLDPNKGDYFATFVVAAKDASPSQTVVSIDGVTGKVSCTENCDYVK